LAEENSRNRCKSVTDQFVFSVQSFSSLLVIKGDRFWTGMDVAPLGKKAIFKKEENS
jgi:hypothetical protein